MKILLIDDDVNLCKVLSYQLKKQGYEVATAYNGRDGLALFRENNYDIVLSDIQMPDVSGLEVLKEIRVLNPEVIIIMITAYGSVDGALEAVRSGADDYITKPFGQEQLLFVIEKAVRMRQLQQENKQLRREVEGKYRFDNMVTNSRKMEEVLQMAGQVAESEATVLLLGESGTGKELLARAIHYNSPRKDKPFITVNCPSIPDNLMESELFGHVKGAFTGAIKDRKGKFELANGGTIFLDEIGDLREDVQAKLLRVLQEHEIERLGEGRPIKVDVRVIAATNKNLEELIRQGKFREDLYYRLSVIPITIPPLRERKEDIPYLVDFFLRRYGKEREFQIDPQFLEVLTRYDWPGNVRELENVIERAVVLTSSGKLTPSSLPAHLQTFVAFTKSRTEEPAKDEQLTLEELEKRAILQALEKSGGNKSRAAKMLDIPRHVLLYRLKKFNLE